MPGNAEALARGRETRDANAAVRRAERIASGKISVWDKRWLQDHGQTVPKGVRVVRTTKSRTAVKKPQEIFGGVLKALAEGDPQSACSQAEVNAIQALPPSLPLKPGPVTFSPRQPQVFALSETPRRVVPGEVDELLEWGLPHFAVCFPDATRDNIRPMLLIACKGPPTYFIRTKYAVGLFILEKTPWNPGGTVHKVFVVAKEHAPAEVLAVYDAGLAWAIACQAKWYHYEGCDGYPITPIADRLGYDATRVTYSKRLK